MKSYLQTTVDVYREAALVPQTALCCVQQARPYLPGLVIPEIMDEMNYGCGTTVHFQDLKAGQRVLYIGVGGGLEALQFAYFARCSGAVIAVDPVIEMRNRAMENLQQAALVNDWFDPDFVQVIDGNALHLPLADRSVDLVAQNCLFNVFEPEELQIALKEVHRVLAPGGSLVLSDPIATRPIPEHLQADERLRAMCLSGCLTLDAYLEQIVQAGFGQIDIRSRRPYRVLDKARYGLEADLLLESIELVAYNVAIPEDGPCIFTGRTAIYTGLDPHFDDQAGHILLADIPTAVCDKTAARFASINHPQITVTAPTFHYQGGGCC